MKLGMASAPEDQKASITHCAQTLCPSVLQEAKLWLQPKEQGIYFKHKIFLSISSKDLILEAYALNALFYQTCSTFSISSPEPSRRIRPSNKVTADPCLDGFISKHINL